MALKFHISTGPIECMHVMFHRGAARDQTSGAPGHVCECRELYGNEALTDDVSDVSDVSASALCILKHQFPLP